MYFRYFIEIKDFFIISEIKKNIQIFFLKVIIIIVWCMIYYCIFYIYKYLIDIKIYYVY